MKSRIVQAIAIIILFVLGVAFWSSSRSTTSEGPSEHYVPPAP